MDIIVILLAGIILGIMIGFKINDEAKNQNKKLIENIKKYDAKKNINPKMLLTKEELKNG